MALLAAKPPMPPSAAHNVSLAPAPPDRAALSVAAGPSPLAHYGATARGSASVSPSLAPTGMAMPPRALPVPDARIDASVPQKPYAVAVACRQPHTITASTSLFAIPFSLSSTSLRNLAAFPPPPPGHIDWISIYVIYIITLVAEAARGLLLPSTWPYFQAFGGQKTMLGVFVASFSFGRMISTVPLGYMSDKMSTAVVLALASAMQVVGHLMYALAPNLFVLYMSRVIVGFGSATMSVSRAHITRAIPPSLRTHHFAYLSGLQFIGFAVLPGLGGLLALLPEYYPLSFVAFNGLTYPAYLLVFANIACLFLIQLFYIDPPSGASPPMAASSVSDNGSAVPLLAPQPIPRPDVFALVVCLLVNVVFRGVIAQFETVSVPFLMEQYSLTYGKSSFFLSAVGFVGLFVYISFKPIARTFSDRVLVLFGLITIVVGCLPLSIFFVARYIPLAMYVLCLGLTWSIAYPVGQTAVLALFSKVLAGLPAGGFLGIFSASGSISRLMFAIAAGFIWNVFGREAVYALITTYVSVMLFAICCTYKRLVPPSVG